MLEQAEPKELLEELQLIVRERNALRFELEQVSWVVLVWDGDWGNAREVGLWPQMSIDGLWWIKGNESRLVICSNGFRFTPSSLLPRSELQTGDGPAASAWLSS